MIKVVNLTKYYGSFAALSNISFTVNEGEVAGFVGINGAGKSTTMKILSGFLPFESGDVKIGGHEIINDSLAVRNIVGYLPEGVPLYPDMRVCEFLKYRASLKNLSGSKRKEAIERVLKSCDIKNRAKSIIAHLSRGYRQRVGIADALLEDPHYLIMDEPTLGLDPIQVKQLRKLLKRIGEKRTIIFSTHILSEVEIVCDSVIIIHKGKIISRGLVHEIKAEAAEVSGKNKDKMSLEDAFVVLVEESDKRNVA